MGYLDLPEGRLAELPGSPAVYRLFRGEEVIYVGASRQVQGRVRYHPLDGEFDGVEIQECAAEDLFRLEREWFDTYKPTMNKRYPSYSGKVRPIPKDVVRHAHPFMHSVHTLSSLVHQVRYLRRENRWGTVNVRCYAKCGFFLRMEEGLGRFHDAVPDGATECARCKGVAPNYDSPSHSVERKQHRTALRTALSAPRPQEAA